MRCAGRVVNTLSVGEAWVSPPVLEELRGRADVEVGGCLSTTPRTTMPCPLYSHDGSNREGGVCIQVLESGLTAFAEGRGELLPFHTAAAAAAADHETEGGGKRHKP